MLQPHNALKELTIRRYGGTTFPIWLRRPSFPDMVVLTIANCKKCTSMPPFGQLPSLKILSIRGMASVKNVGPELCGMVPRNLLDLWRLSFEDMEEWENWSPCEAFPNLLELSIESCPKLLGNLPNHLPLLKKGKIRGCWKLVISISSFPDLCELEIAGSEGVVCRSKVDFSSLKFGSLSTISEFTSQIEGFTMDGLTNVEDLTVDYCVELRHLWSNDVGSLPHLPCLRSLKIDECPKLVSLVAEEVEEKLLPGLPSTLRKMMYNNTCLEDIFIYRCDTLTYFAKGQLPPTLKKLKIEDCKNMRILVEEDDTNSCSSSNSTSLLQEFSIYNCPSLKSLTSSGELPLTLRTLIIGSCPKLESIAKGLHHCSFLKYIDIRNCENLKCFPTGAHSLSHLDRICVENCPSLDFFPDGVLLPAKLTQLAVVCCEKMQALLNCMHNFTSLQGLRMGKCPTVVSFPEEGFPTNLTYLSISDLNIAQGLFEWGLHRFTSLKRLRICGGSSHLVSFPEMKLSTSLINFTINSFPNLEYLSSEGFRNLASLERLSIFDCEKLRSFPENGLPPSLLELSIVGCEKFMSFPKNGLPPSLLQLCIYKCPMLEERCKKYQGREWVKIAHIPSVSFHSYFSWL